MKEINAEIVSHKLSELPSDLAIDIALVGENFGASNDGEVLLDAAKACDDCVVSTVYVDGQIKLVVIHSSDYFRGRALAAIHAVAFDNLGSYELEECLLRVADSIPTGDETDTDAASALVIPETIMDVLDFEDPYELGIIRTLVKVHDEWTYGILSDWSAEGVKWWAQDVAPLDVDVQRTIVGHPEDLTHKSRYKVALKPEYGIKTGQMNAIIATFESLEVKAGELFLIFSDNFLVPWKQVKYIYAK
mgnify:CR=1 FL=1|tara:strand:- start:7260 stop:8000 length:741 start_codon:yes stop_codon:yes gene_type:complete